MGRKRKAPEGMQWRGKTLYSEFQIKGVPIRRSLKTDDPTIAKERLKALKLTFRNVPLEAEPVDGTCLFTGEPAVERIFVARAY